MMGGGILETLFSAVLEAGVDLLVEVGFGDEVKELKKKLTRKDEKKRREAFMGAMDKASEALDDQIIWPLLAHGPFREEVIAALLDPRHTMDFQAAAKISGERSPREARALRSFFSNLESALLADPLWGPVLDRFQDLRFRRNVEEALKEKRLDFSPRDLAQRLSPRLPPPDDEPLPTGESLPKELSLMERGSDAHQVVQLFVRELILACKPPDDSGPLGVRYLRQVSEDANLLPWHRVEASHANPCGGADLRLADVYTALDTTELNAPEKRLIDCEEDLRKFMSRIHKEERIPAQEMADREDRLLIMGDPGSGKSTFMKFLAYVLARAGLMDDPSSFLARLSLWRHGPLLPVRVELRHLAAFADDHKEHRRNGCEKLLRSYLHHKMLADWDLERYWSELEKAIRGEGPPLLILLDGLDEVPTDRRQMVVDTVNDFCLRHGSHRYMVTCRPYAYIGQPWRLHYFREVTLAPFDEKQIELFVENWYKQLAERGRFSRLDAGIRTARLQGALKRRDLRGLAERPLLLTIMAQLDAFKGKLPDDRTDLYADSVKLLLERWEQDFGSEAGILKRLNRPDLRLNNSDLKMSDIEAGLYFVAYEAHARHRSEGETADVGEGDLLIWLKPYLANDLNRAQELVDYIRERAGLLIRHKTEAYTFPHRTFQEFLAACHLTSLHDYPGESEKLVCNDPDRWREVFILAAGHAARNHRLSQSIAAVNAICPQGVESDPADATDPQPWRLAQLAGEALLEIGLVGVQREKPGRAVYDRVRSWLAEALRRDKLLTSLERAACGRILAKLGDPRTQVTTVDGMEFRPIPAGPFIMGGRNYGEPEEKEQPRRVVYIPYDFQISRYPITNAQFREFVEAGGYRDSRYWKEAAKEGFWKDGKVKFYRDDSPREEPRDFGEPFNLSNHPVVGVAWYEALAFTRWLRERLLDRGVIPYDCAVRLPDEAEWEKSSLGGMQGPDASPKGREPSILRDSFEAAPTYPWGDSPPDRERANYKETGINTTSAVGCFPGGASPYEVEELIGNVWEWTRSMWSESSEAERTNEEGKDLGVSPYTGCVIKGGNFNTEKDALRCGVRGGDLPNYRYHYVGFRVVSSRFTSGL